MAIRDFIPFLNRSATKIVDADIVSMERSLVRTKLDEQKIEGYKSLTSSPMPVDFYPIYTTVKLPKRKQEVGVQVISDYYLYRMEKYWETEGIIYRSINKLLELITQVGFTFKSFDKGGRDKFTDRFNLLLRRGETRYTIDTFIRRTLHDYLLYGNQFTRKMIGDSENILQVNFMDPLSMSVLLNRDNQEKMYYVSKRGLRKRGDIEKQIKKQLQTPANYGPMGKFFRYAPNVFYQPEEPDERIDVEEINHIKYIDMPQNAISIPPLYPVINDVLALRSIEDDILLLSYQYGHPFLHGTIKREGMTAEQILLETRHLRDQIQKMEGNGFLITSDLVDVQLKGPQGAFPNLIEFHKLFRERIEKGAGVSDLFTGNGGGVGRQTSETVEKSTYSYINDLANSFAYGMQLFFDEFFNRNIANYRGSKVYDPCPIEFRFNEADRAEKRASEQHLITLFQTSAISHGEFREKLDMAVDPKLKDKYFFEIMPTKTDPGTGTGNKVSSQISPSNQYGKKTTAGKSKKDLLSTQELEEVTNIE